MAQKTLTAKKVAAGAASVAATAGVVAVVAAMADKDIRNSVVKGTNEVLKAASSNGVTSAVTEQFQTTAHQIRLSNKKKPAKKTKAASNKTQ